MTFESLGLSQSLLNALKKEGYETPTPIQAQAIPLVLEGHDVLGCAQTGTGKTAAFALPLLQILAQTKVPHSSKRPIRALILTPTRELAMQIKESFDAYGNFMGFKNLVIFGGVGQNTQTDGLRAGVDILVATPGRLLDLMQQGFISLNDVGIFVLDEADRMLDMGFLNDVKRIIAKLPQKRQTLFFSATMAPDILKLASGILNNPKKVEVTPISSTAQTVQQAVYFVEKDYKKKLLIHLLKDKEIKTMLVFTRTKHGANRLAQDLFRFGIEADAIHGNKSQSARQRALDNFKSGELRVLVATDIAARGIDVDSLSHVVNYELPNIPETYVHRIGRTGRAGASGIAISFCDTEEREYLRDIQKLIELQIPLVSPHSYESENNAPIPYPSVRMLNKTQATERQPVNQKAVPSSKQQGNRPLVGANRNEKGAANNEHWRPWKYRKDKAK
jgi:ATP-dependent RNA helicase RhlE